jgi:glycosyltransferase involved in cell wall biosynthesis
MYENKSIAIVVPAYNEASQIGKVIMGIPDFVDKIVIINDGSKDNTKAVVEQYQKQNDRIILLDHPENLGVGAAIITGYNWVKEHDFDVAVRMDGDGQMNPEDLTALINPIVENRTDYAKGNRLFTGEAYQNMPKARYFGNAFLSLLTKIVSGYWHVSDFQSGYTAINKKALKTVDWNRMYTDYGQPNDLLVRLNVYNFRVTDIPVEPVYNVGEQSGLKIYKVIFTISWLLFKLFFWRMKEKYIIRDFHPLIFFYLLGFFFGSATLVLFGRIFYYWIMTNHIPAINALAAFFSFMSTSLFTLFAMMFDMEANKDLKGTL